MALGKQLSCKAHILAYLQTAKAHGVRVAEHPAFGGVHAVHVKGSWHYDGLAGDMNTRAGASAAERSELAPWADLADLLGIAYILDRTGRGVGTAATHRNHLHIDAGATTNYGNGNVAVDPTSFPTLNNGSRGLPVEVIQRELLIYGFNPGPVDEHYGPSTKAAVAAYQSSRGLGADGVAGPKTWAQMRRP